MAGGDKKCENSNPLQDLHGEMRMYTREANSGC